MVCVTNVSMVDRRSYNANQHCVLPGACVAIDYPYPQSAGEPLGLSRLAEARAPAPLPLPNRPGR